jgi:hypothetical protein
VPRVIAGGGHRHEQIDIHIIYIYIYISTTFYSDMQPILDTMTFKAHLSLYILLVTIVKKCVDTNLVKGDIQCS